MPNVGLVSVYRLLYNHCSECVVAVGCPGFMKISECGLRSSWASWLRTLLLGLVRDRSCGIRGVVRTRHRVLYTDMFVIVWDVLRAGLYT